MQIHTYSVARTTSSCPLGAQSTGSHRYRSEDPLVGSICRTSHSRVVRCTLETNGIAIKKKPTSSDLFLDGGRSSEDHSPLLKSQALISPSARR